MSECTLPPPLVTSGVDLADWIETVVVVEGREKISRAKLRGRLRGASLTDGEDVEVAADLALQEVRRRGDMTGDAYPFDVTGSVVQLASNADTCKYEFLLLLSTSSEFRKLKDYGDADRLFDLLALAGLKAYLGPAAKGVRFAYPSSDGRPPGFVDALAWLRDLLQLGEGRGFKQPTKKDAGVDVVVWRPFRDGRAGFLTILAQCTVMLDWHHKAKDIVIDLWRGYVDFGKDPLTSLVIPFVVPPGFERWDELRRTVWLVVDRLRLCALLEGIQPACQDEVLEWVEQEKQRLRSAA